MVSVIYRNEGDQPWSLNTPTQSALAELRFEPTEGERASCGYTVGRVAVTQRQYRGKWFEEVYLPDRRPLTIEPGQSFAFELPLERGWSGHLVPGGWKVWFEDREQKIESNHFQLALRFTHDSITACLERATDRGVRGSEQKWHADWLKKIMPGLDVTWGNRNTPPGKMARIRAQRAKGFEEFRAFLGDPKNAEAIQAAIDQINREAGLPVEEEKPEAAER